MKKLTFIIILFASVCVYAQTDDKNTLKQLNENLVLSYKNGKLDDALKFANQAVELSLKIFGSDNAETATAYTNLGIIQREKLKYNDSISSLQKSIEIYEKSSNLKKGVLSNSYEKLAESYKLSGKQKETEESYLKSLDLCERDFGLESKQTLGVVFGIANYYAQTKNFDKADEFYLRSYKLVVKNFGELADEVADIDLARAELRDSLYFFNWVKKKPSDIENDKIAISDLQKREKAFQLEKDKIFRDRKNENITYGKIKKVVKADYPKVANSVGAIGKVSVRIMINQEGIVVKANAISGHPLLHTSAVEAAFLTKFEPTTVIGKPIKTIGVIDFSFVRQ
jgi:tetratricopeptide (TPR) repeat protein